MKTAKTIRMKIYALRWHDENRLYSEGREIPIFATRKEALERVKYSPIDDLATARNKKLKIVCGEVNFDLS